MAKYLPLIISIVLLLVITILIHRVWFLTNSVIIGSDWGYFFLDTMKEWFPIHSIWNSQLNFGYFDLVSVPFTIPYFVRSLLASLNVPFIWIDRFTYLFPVALLAPLSMYLLIYKLTKNSFGAFFAALLYSINTYILTIQIGHFTLALVYAIFPLLFYTFVKYLEKPRYKLLYPLIILSLISFSNEARIFLIGSFILIIYMIYTLILSRKKLQKKYISSLILQSLVGILIFIGCISFFSFPLFYSILNASSGIEDVAGRGFFGAEYFLLQNAALLFHPFWSGGATTEFIPQSVPPFMWLIPFYAFLSIFFLRKNRFIGFFILLAAVGIFFSKGISDPFGKVYEWMYYNIPGFNLFREPSKFYFIVAFSYSVLTGFTCYYVSLLFQKRIRFTHVGLILSILFFTPFLFICAYVAKPAFTGELAQAFQETSLPPEYVYLKDYLKNQQEYFRVMFVPNRQRFEFLSSQHPSLSYYGIDADFQSLDPVILGSYSVKYIILPYDSTNDVYRHSAPFESWKRKIESYKEYKKINDKRLGKITMYENTSFSPLLYVPKTSNKVNKPSEYYIPLATLYNPNHNAFVFTDTKTPQAETIDTYSRYIYIPDCIKCDGRKPWEFFNFPFARFLPGSVLYPYISWKEHEELHRFDKKSDEYIDKVGYFSLKRIVEVQSMYRDLNKTDYIVQSFNKNSHLIDSMNAFIGSIEDAKLKNNILLKLSDYLAIEMKLMEDMIGESKGEMKSLLQSHYYIIADTFYKIDKKTWHSIHGKKRYTFDVNYSTEFTLLTPKSSNLVNNSLFIDSLEFMMQDQVESIWLTGGKVALNSGRHLIDVGVQNEKNLINVNDQRITVGIEEGIKKVRLPLANLNNKIKYIVTFDFMREQGKSARFFIRQDADRIRNGHREVYADGRLEGIEGVWDDHLTIFQPKDSTNDAYLEFWIEADIDKETIFHLKNITVTQEETPLVAFIEENSNLRTDAQILSYQKSNLSSYEAIVKSTRVPYLLIFNEQYHPGWKMYINGNLVKEQNHTIVNGFANGWWIDTAGENTIRIEFEPQRWYIYGLIASVVVLITTSLFFIRSLTKV